MDTTPPEKSESPENDNSSSETESNDEVATCSKASIPSRLGKCEVCVAVDARYTCPKCELKTCSLPCVRIHKKELDCDGKRDRTKYIPLRSMTNMDFMSDYYFLEECTRYVENRKTDGVKRCTRYNKQLPTHLYRLRAAAHERGTKLHFLLQNFTRHKDNTTYYDWKERRIYWRVEWIFMNAGERKYVDERCAEDQPLCKFLKKYLDAEKAVLENVPEHKELEFYQSKGIFGVKILLKAEYIKQCQNRFYELDASKTLKKNLAGKILVEYPTIYLFCDSVTDDLDIIDSDEDVEAETKAFLDSLDELRKNQLQTSKLKAKATESDSENEAVEGLKKKVVQPKSEEVKRKRQKIEKQTQNFLFNDNEEFSTSSEEEEGKETVSEVVT